MPPASRALYMCNIPLTLGKIPILRGLEEFGDVVELNLTNDWAFVEFVNPAHAEEMHRRCARKGFLGISQIKLEMAQPILQEIDTNCQGKKDMLSLLTPPPTALSPRLTRTVFLTRLSTAATSQHIATLAREIGGTVLSYDVDFPAPGEGFIEYSTILEAERALHQLRGHLLLGKLVEACMRKAGTQQPLEARIKSPAQRLGTHRRTFKKPYRPCTPHHTRENDAPNGPSSISSSASSRLSSARPSSRPPRVVGDHMQETPTKPSRRHKPYFKVPPLTESHSTAGHTHTVPPKHRRRTSGPFAHAQGTLETPASMCS